jgi:TRAP-type uncharacterized transport system fused permease subunit
LWDSSVAALRLGATGYIIPFMFVFGPSLLLIGDGLQVVQTSITAIIGVVCLAAGLSGYLITTTRKIERVILISAAFVLIKPGISTDLIGAALIAIALLLQIKSRQAASTNHS